MTRIYRHIVLTALLAVTLFSSCNRDEEKVIPRSKLARIYAEMFLTDQWITNNPGMRQIADTSLVYEPILEKDGYTSADYRRTVDVYMDDPERFSRILRTTGEILNEKLADLKRRQAQLEHEKALEKLRESRRIKSDFRAEDFFPYLFDEPYVHYYDSLTVEPDSVLMVYRIIPIERADTIYRDLRMIILDSLEVSDSVKVDSLAVADTLKAVHDILPVNDTAMRVRRVMKPEFVKKID